MHYLLTSNLIMFVQSVFIILTDKNVYPARQQVNGISILSPWKAENYKDEYIFCQ